MLESNLSFFISFVPLMLLIFLLQYALFMMTKKCKKINKFFRPSYVIKTTISLFLFEQNSSYLVYICFGHIKNSFTFAFFDKLSLAFTVSFLFCLISFSGAFYFLIEKYLKNKSRYFRINVLRSLAGNCFCTAKALRYFLRGCVYSFLNDKYKIEVGLLSFI